MRIPSTNILIRPIKPTDNVTVASIIRNSLTEYKANKPGTVFFDPTTDDLYALFDQQPGSKYFVAEVDGNVIGGAGVFPTKGLPNGTCELVKIYLAKEARGLGIGKLLMNKCLVEAKALGYTSMYLETMPELTDAIPMYEKFGFKFIDGALGNSGHTGCTVFMMKDL
jgi:putative acetyltransferase